MKISILCSELEAEDKIDSSDVWYKVQATIENHELSDEINKKIFKLELELMDYVLKNINDVKPMKQNK